MREKRPGYKLSCESRRGLGQEGAARRPPGREAAPRPPCCGADSACPVPATPAPAPHPPPSPRTYGPHIRSGRRSGQNLASLPSSFSFLLVKHTRARTHTHAQMGIAFPLVVPLFQLEIFTFHHKGLRCRTWLSLQPRGFRVGYRVRSAA